MEPLAETAARLSASSRRSHQNPHRVIAWPEAVPRPQWFMSPELLSIYGTPRWDSLSEARRQELSFWEAVNFFSLNIHGETALTAGLTERLHRPGFEGTAEYLTYFLHEENQHSAWFATFCGRYAGKVYPDRKIVFPADVEKGEGDFLFFARVALFEAIVDRHNLTMGRDDRLARVARMINAQHHADETRHLIFGRRVVEHLWHRHRPEWSDETVARIRGHLAGYVLMAWREYYNPDAYRDAGLAEPWASARQAWDDPASHQRRQRMSRRALAPFLKRGILEVEPGL